MNMDAAYGGCWTGKRVRNLSFRKTNSFDGTGTLCHIDSIVVDRIGYYREELGGKFDRFAVGIVGFVRFAIDFVK